MTNQHNFLFDLEIHVF